MANKTLKKFFQKKTLVDLEYFHDPKDVAARQRLHRNIRVSLSEAEDTLAELVRELDKINPSQRMEAWTRVHRISTWRKRLSLRAASANELMARHDEILSQLCWVEAALKWTADALERARPSNLDVRRHIIEADQCADQLAGLRHRIDTFDTCIGLR